MIKKKNNHLKFQIKIYFLSNLYLFSRVIFKNKMNNLFDGIFGIGLDAKPTDFYYKISSNGTKMYYSKLNGCRYAKKVFPVNFLNKITEQRLVNSELNESKESLLGKRKDLETQIESLKLKIVKIENKLKNGEFSNSEKTKEDYEREDNILKEKRKQEKQKFWTNFFDEFSNKYGNAPPKWESSKKQESKFEEEKKFSNEILKKHNINSKDDWKKWMQKNHPDKKRFSNNDDQKIHNELVQNIMNAAKIKKWIK